MSADSAVVPAGDLTPVDLSRRDFLLRFCQGVGATLVPSSLWQFASAATINSGLDPAALDDDYILHPRYRSERPLDKTLAKVRAGSDEFVSEQYADQINNKLAEWAAALLRSPQATELLLKFLAADFSGASLKPVESRIARSNSWLEVHRNKFASGAVLSRDQFAQHWRELFSAFARIATAEFQITRLESKANAAAAPPSLQLHSEIRYEVAGTGTNFYREQRVGTWELEWQRTAQGEFRIHRWSALEESIARSREPVFIDVTSAALGANPSYAAQMLHGTDYWRTILDGATGIDVYGHNGVSVADVDGDGFDDLYVCQPAGLPNRLYRNRGNATFEDITDASGLGVLENTACALFADFTNQGRQDVIVVRAGGPLLFINEGGGKFRPQPDAFRFATPPQGTFTGAAVADYDRDGWLDIYFCLYSYYQGTGQYKYPSPYHAAENGPPNFLMRNQRDGSFLDVTAPAGLNANNTRYSFCCAWNDYNRDGWPDLYVVNDFGRKNLYRNNGDGTFTDVAAQAAAEDIGAGMSVSWLDFDRDGADDLYVGNMWTAAGQRISTQENFKPDSSKEVRSLDQKHAMGNSLLRNRGAAFEDVTRSAGVPMGRWAWSCDAFDFDHDGFLDLYITNGMVSGPVRPSPSSPDLNSFFWRQVVARSPDEARPSEEYEHGWNAINELTRSDETWSGYERNVFYANNSDGTFSDISAAVGLDFIEDGRSFALADFDHDGRLEVLLKNRNAPQLRLLKNAVTELPPSIAFRLRGTKGNRDAIGASITIETSAGRQTRSLQAGSAFLSQHSKDVFFGLGNARGPVQASIRWPSGLVQKLANLPVNHRISVIEGAEMPRVEPFKSAKNPARTSAEVVKDGELLPRRFETWLLSPIAAPDFSLPDWSGQVRTLSSFRSKPVLLNLSAAESPSSPEELQRLQKVQAACSAKGLQVISLDLGESGNADLAFARKLSFPVLRGSDDVAAIYDILYRQMFDRHRDLSLPTSFLLNNDGEIVKVYRGFCNPGHVAHDFQNIPRNESERLAQALPFPGAAHSLEFGRNYLSYGSLFFQRGYLDQAGVSFQQALRDDPSSAEALYGIGSVYLNQNKNAAARDAFERCIKLTPTYPGTLPDAWNNLGVIATREGHIDESIEYFQQALQLNPHHLLSLENLGNAYRSQKRWDDARLILQRALEVAPDDAEANYALGMVYAQTGDNAKAYEYLQRALKARPDYPEALNNLGILYLVTQRRDEAVASFERCIQAAPSFDQAYLNLARVYALEGSRDKARGVLLELMKQHPEHAQARQMLEQLR